MSLLKKRRKKEAAEVFTESLNDIMFFLLLFFIILSTLVNPNVIKVNLPDSKKTEVYKGGKVLLQVNKDHQFFVNNTPIEFAQLEAALKTEVTAKQTDNVILVLERTLTVQDLADILQIGSKLGVKMVLSAKTL